MVLNRNTTESDTEACEIVHEVGVGGFVAVLAVLTAAVTPGVTKSPEVPSDPASRLESSKLYLARLHASFDVC
jgi:hypothetical protein